MPYPSVFNCNDRFFDARNFLEWETITLEIEVSGSFDYTDSMDTRHEGVISGGSVLILTRSAAAYDRAEPPEAGPQGIAAQEFKSYRLRCGFPIILLNYEGMIATEGTGQLHVSFTDTPEEEEPSTITGDLDVFFDLGFSSAFEGGSVPLLALAYSGSEGVEVFNIGQEAALDPIPLLLWTGDDYIESIDRDLLSPEDGITVIGSQNETFTVTVA